MQIWVGGNTSNIHHPNLLVVGVSRSSENLNIYGDWWYTYAICKANVSNHCIWHCMKMIRSCLFWGLDSLNCNGVQLIHQTSPFAQLWHTMSKPQQSSAPRLFYHIYHDDLFINYLVHTRAKLSAVLKVETNPIKYLKMENYIRGGEKRMLEVSYSISTCIVATY